jgi:DNA-binding HxlR family transcriptional regulator
MTKIKASSTNQHNRKTLNDFCGVMYAIDILEKKTMRFLELKKKLPEISDRMLTLHLRELEKDGMVRREVFAEVPPRVEYSLTESAMELIPVWQQLEKWGLRHRDLTAAGYAGS